MVRWSGSASSSISSPAPASRPEPLALPAGSGESEFAAYDLLDQRVAATRRLLESDTPNLFTIHLFYTTEAGPERIEDFLQRAENLVDISEIYVTARGTDRRRFRVTYGTFRDSDDARAVMKELPERFRKGFRLQVTTLNQLRRTG